MAGVSRPMLRALSGALACAALALGGCTSSPGTAPPSSRETERTPSGTPSTGAPTPTRTTAATWASIGQLDPCKLSAAGRQVTFAGRLGRGATTCTTWTSAQDSDVVTGVGRAWNSADARGLTRTSLAGFEAWAGPVGPSCFVLLPAGGTSVDFTSSDQPDCGPLLAQVTAVLTRLRSDPHAFDLAAPRPVACQVLSNAGLTPAGDDATACTSGDVTAWVLDTSTHPDDARVALGDLRGTRSRRLAQEQGLSSCSVRWRLTSGIEAAILAPTCERAADVARAAAAGRQGPPDPGPLAFDPAA